MMRPFLFVGAHGCGLVFDFRERAGETRQNDVDYKLAQDRERPMPEISEAHRRKMEKSFRFDVAQHIAAAAARKETITYGDLTRQFGGTDRGWGDTLGGIALRCHKAGWPVLSVLVVSKQTGLPSADARLYKDLGLETTDAMAMEQQRCFAVDWTQTPLAGR